MIEKTAICKKCYKQTWHDKTSEEIANGVPHYNCGGEIVLINNSEIVDNLEVGCRYDFIDKNDNKKRYTVGKTTGWKPVLLAMHNSRSWGSSITLSAKDYKGYDFMHGAYRFNTYFI